MAKWHWDNVKSVRGWTQFDNYLDIEIETNDGHTHKLSIYCADDNDTVGVDQYMDGRLVNCDGAGEPGYCEKCERVHR